MDIKPGARLHSTVCTTQVVVVRGSGPVELTCGGAPMSDTAAPASGTPAPGLGHGTTLGKRYADEAGTVEVLCVKPGQGSLALDGTELRLKEAKQLPASD